MGVKLFDLLSWLSNAKIPFRDNRLQPLFEAVSSLLLSHLLQGNQVLFKKNKNINNQSLTARRQGRASLKITYQIGNIDTIDVAGIIGVGWAKAAKSAAWTLKISYEIDDIQTIEATAAISITTRIAVATAGQYIEIIVIKH